MPDKRNPETQLEFLAALEKGEVVTQMALSRRIAVSVGMVNALLSRAARKGFVKAKAAPYKRYAYYLTPKGFREKSRLVTEYLESSLAFFRRARAQYREIFLRAEAAGMRRIAFAGSGELAEIALLAAHETGVEIVMVLDRKTNKNRLYGLEVVRSLEDLKRADGIVIVDTGAPQEAFDFVAGHVDDQKIMTPPFLKISRLPPNFGGPDAARVGSQTHSGHLK